MSDLKVYAPLQQFVWSGKQFLISPGFEITRFLNIPDLRGLETGLASEEIRDLVPQHWLAFEWKTGEEPSAAEVVNLFLLALWIVKPTRSHVAVRFEVSSDLNHSPGGTYRMLDRFNFVPGAVADRVEDSDLSAAASYFLLCRALRLADKRLVNGLLLTFAGCTATHWQVAFVCHAGAAEALLTYDTGRGITRRLATSYACLVESAKANRDLAFTEFAELYEVRSDIMHGRAHRITSADRLPTLGRLEGLLRRLWRAILSSPSHVVDALEGTDSDRAAYLNQLQSGYSPP